MKKMRILYIITKALSLLLVFVLFSCEKNVEDLCDSEISFTADISPIIDGRCLECHSGSVFPDLRTFSGITDNANLIRQQVVSRAMPRGSTLTEDQIELISCWIDNGTLDN